MRDLTVRIGGEEVQMRGTFRAAEELAQHVGDPIAFAREQHLASALPGYQPKLALTVQNIPIILHIGAKAAGDKRTLDQWRELAFEAGYLECIEPATAYLLHVTTPQSQREPEKGGGEAGE